MTQSFHERVSNVNRTIAHGKDLARRFDFRFYTAVFKESYNGTWIEMREGRIQKATLTAEGLNDAASICILSDVASRPA